MPLDIPAVGAAFDIPGVFLEAAPYGSGHINDTFVARYACDKRDKLFTFQRINPRVFKKPEILMANIARVCGHLADMLQDTPEGDRRALHLLKTPEGAPCWTDPLGHVWRVYRFIDQARTVDVVTTDGQAFEAAKTVGHFQRLLSHYKGPRLYETIPDFHHTPKRIEAFEQVLSTDPRNRATSAAPEIAFVRRHASLAGALTSRMAAGEMSERITHNDTKINNVLLDIHSGSGLCMIDLDTVMPGLALYDFGDLVRTSVSPAAEGTLDLDRIGIRHSIYDALVEGYLSQMADQLSPAEHDCLTLSGQLITFEIGLRFLTDYLAGDVYFKTHHPGHNLERCRTQFRLVTELEAQTDTLERTVQRHLRQHHPVGQ